MVPLPSPVYSQPPSTSVKVEDDFSMSIPLSREQLAIEQKKDPELTILFDNAVAENDVNSISTGYFARNGVLMRKWKPTSVSMHEDWWDVHQIVVPCKHRREILYLAHDNPLAGHLGISKTYDRILRCFFWPALKRDVVSYCRSCHACQLAGKPNQAIPPAPLQPIPAFGELFERILVDCVGPLPVQKAETSTFLQ